MIRSKNELFEYINYEKKLYCKKKQSISFFPLFSENSILWRFVCLLRFEEYHLNTKHFFRYRYFKLRRVLYRMKYGLNVVPNTIDKGFKLYHVGSILINAEHIGKNFSCQINCACIAGGHDGKSPTIGDNVCMGYGSTIVGNVKIANGIAVGACAMVNKSFEEENICIAGIPARKISNNGSSTWGGRDIYNNVK